ncbi:hypothetical protein Taro_003825 [Colocasia esculenta]|uniref:Uncharacterized protein n=1 Tax=Colocasia esculenta TaxID=4460 RepID=A0A843TN97_COLES|nr:hypothetical protein [Colocasia esculenta]
MSRRSARIQALSSSVVEPEGAGVDRHEEDRVDTARGRTAERIVASPPRNRTNVDLNPHKIVSHLVVYEVCEAQCVLCKLEEVSELIDGVDVLYFQFLGFDEIIKKEKIKLNVFCASLKHNIGGKICSLEILAVQLTATKVDVNLDRVYFMWQPEASLSTPFLPFHSTTFTSILLHYIQWLTGACGEVAVLMAALDRA